MTRHLHDKPASSRDGLPPHDQLHRLVEKAQSLTETIAALDGANRQPHTLIGLALEAKALIEEATLALTYGLRRPGKT